MVFTMRQPLHFSLFIFDRLCLPAFLRILMAHPAHRAMTAVASAGGLPLLLIAIHLPYDTCHHSQQDDGHDDRSEIVSDPVDHLDIAFSLRSFDVSLSASLYFLMKSI